MGEGGGRGEGDRGGEKKKKTTEVFSLPKEWLVLLSLACYNSMVLITN